jgi:general L-amino acid transport system permease protein
MTVEAPPREEVEVPTRAAKSWAWVRDNLFNTWYNALLTLLIGGIGLWATVGVFRYLLGSDFTVIEVNLRLFMIGQFPLDQLWRPWLATALIAVLVGLAAGGVAASARDRAEESGLIHRQTRMIDIVRRFWPMLVLVVIILSFTRTITPTILTIVVGALGLGSYYLGRVLPRAIRAWMWLIVIVLLLATYLALAGFGGVGWARWGGLQLNLFLTVAGIGFAFPLGLLLALGRKSSLPLVRTVSVGYIELIRGVPLITMLLAGVFAIGFLIPSDLRPGQVTRMLLAITLFEAAYIAEVVRGGLQAVPRGQVEASQALGVGTWKTMRLVVLPQALRATIPAMVGQFISLFKDTTLVSILGANDLLNVGFVVNSQPAFLGQGLFIITIGFAGLIFWVGSYTMSREAGRLERRLGVGER